MGNDEITDKLTLLIEKYPLNDNQFFLRQYAQAKQQKFYDNKIQSIDFFKLPGEINSKIGYYLTEKEDKVSLLVACTKKAKM